MSDAVRLKAQRVAAQYLRELLLKPGTYRETWQRRAVRPHDDVINQLAVMEVIADYRRSAMGRAADGDIPLYQLRDLVSGGLSGWQLSSDTLQLFIDAFGFSADEAGRLRRLLAGSSRIGVLSGLHGVPIGAEQDVDAALGPRRHQTLSLHDHIWVGPDARIDRARTMQVIEAIAPGVDRIPFLIDTNVLTLEVGQGCKELVCDVRQISATHYATEILLTRTLELGETLTLEYWLSYRWPGDPRDPAEHEYRRGAMRRIDNLDMRIEFHPDRLPAELWWAHWDGGDDRTTEQEAVTLDIQCSVHRYVRSIERSIVGFHWRWE